MLIAIAVIMLLVLIVLGVLLFQKLGERVNQQNLSIQEIKDLLGSGHKTQDLLHTHLSDTMKAVNAIKVSHDERKNMEAESRKSIRHLEEIIAGTKTKGIAGENILREVFRSFPTDMVASNVKIKGKEVEFGMILTNKKIVPIDVKWPTTRLLEDMNNEIDDTKRERIRNEIEHEVNRRVAEIAQYIDPNLTMPWAVGAVPDSVYGLLKRAHFDAYKKNVIIISYSMTIPYLLTLFMMHTQFGSTVDLENLKHHLSSIKHHLGAMAEVLDNKICRANKMLENASLEYRQMLGSIQSSINLLETSGSERKEIEIE